MAANSRGLQQARFRPTIELSPPVAQRRPGRLRAAAAEPGSHGLEALALASRQPLAVVSSGSWRLARPAARTRPQGVHIAGSASRIVKGRNSLSVALGNWENELHARTQGRAFRQVVVPEFAAGARRAGLVASVVKRGGLSRANPGRVVATAAVGQPFHLKLRIARGFVRAYGSQFVASARSSAEICRFLATISLFAAGRRRAPVTGSFRAPKRATGEDWGAIRPGNFASDPLFEMDRCL